MKKTNMLILSLLILTAVVLSCGTAAAVEVNTIEELQSNVSDAVGDLTIQLGDNFPEELTNVISLTLNNDANVTIIGGTKTDLMTIKQTGNTKHFNVADSSSTAANIEFKNIVFVGGIPDSVLDSDGSFNGSTNHNGLPGGGGINGGAKGKTTFENCDFKQIRGGVFSNPSNLVLKNSTFVSNSNNFNAILNTTKPLTIENCTFAYNYGNGWGGYSGGSIGLYGDSQCTISNTVFINNFFAGGGSGQGGGGVISFVSGTTNSFLTITDCVFENNTLSSVYTDAKSTTADGGALYLYKMVGEIYISGSTFENNSAYDEAGAISFQGTTNSKNRVENCTFYGNVAKGLQPDDEIQGGGAIELYYVSGRANVTFEGNTFVKNVAEKGNSKNQAGNKGGAMYLYLSTATLINNIISGNIDSHTTPAPNIYSNIGTVTNKGGNFINESIEDVFGTNNPTPVEIGSKKAGDPKSDFYGIIKTIPLNPEGNAFNNGLKPDHTNTTLAVDQNDKLRNENTPSSGSVELQSVKYDLGTEGEWRAGEFIKMTDENDTANGTVINRASEFKSDDYFYQLVFEDGTDTPVTSRIPVHKTDSSKVFLWWANETDEKTTETDGSKNIVLTPVWGDLQYTVIFQDWDDAELKKESVSPGADATAPADPSRSGYTFTGWDKDFTNVQSDLIVTAQYKINETKTTEKSGGSSTGKGNLKSEPAGEKEGYEIEEIIPEIIKPVLVILLFVIAIACYFYVRNSRED